RTVSIDFVDCDENRFAAATETDGSFTVKWDDAFLNIDDEDDDVCGFDGQFDLFECRAGDDVIGFLAAKQADAAGIHKGESASMPFGFGGNAVASYARSIVDDGDAAANNPIEEGGFSDVWTTDNGDETGHGASALKSWRVKALER